jgi:hypothetical protein
MLMLWHTKWEWKLKITEALLYFFDHENMKKKPSKVRYFDNKVYGTTWDV